MIVQMLKSMGVISITGGFLGGGFTNSLYSGVAAMIGGLIIVPLVSLITPKPDKRACDEMFACYGERVTVEAVKSLGD